MNLIICTTPFQMLLAEKIIDVYIEEEFFLVVITDNMNDKYQYYYNKLLKKVKKAICIKTLLTHNIKICRNFFDVLDLLYFRLYGVYLGNRSYKKIFLANVESFRVHMFLSGFKNYELYTFDDGTANIIEGSHLYKETLIGAKKRLLMKIIGNKLSLSILKSKSKLHFTIYKDLKNIIDNVYCIELFSDKLDKLIQKTNANFDNVSKEIKIFLGQPLYEFNPILYERISSYLKLYNIDYYFSHPRETKCYFSSVKYIETSLLFEDYLLKELMGKDVSISVYTIFSSSLLNIINFPNITLFAIYDKEVEKMKEIYEIFRKKGVNIVSYGVDSRV
ncbi:glycosyltransferase family 52 [Gallibacterium trehalosifermentans]|uniref:Glycosyltransferase family 52 n=1 Tax=Gallibacterium trehalosifermentans TaxID=516935 RepID=A0ABV6GY40_9PAST